MPYHHLSAIERGQVQVFLDQGQSLRATARALGRSPSTISREVARNGGVGKYRCEKAQARYKEARRASRRTCTLAYLPLRRYLVDKMTDGWSPEQVSGRLWWDCPGQPRMRVSHETIYRSLYRDEKLRNILLGCLRQRHPRRRRRGERRPTRPFIPNRVGIEARPPQVQTLERYGDWEGDLIIGAQQQGAILTLVERKSLLLRAHWLPSRHARGVAKAVVAALGEFPKAWRRTITFDNGSEFAHHEAMAQDLDLDIYFAHPYAAYERGCNENTNGLLRQYLPKGTSFISLPNSQLQRYVEELNDRPRKKLEYRTPNEVANLNNVALQV